MFRKVVYILSLVFSVIHLNAQNCLLEILSPDSIPFMLVVNSEKVTDSAVVDISIPSRHGAKALNFLIKDDSSSTFTTQLRIEPDTRSVFHLTQIGDQYTLISALITRFEFESDSVDVTQHEAIIQDTLMIAIDTVIGVGDCFPKSIDFQFNSFLDELQSMPFESERLKHIKGSVQHYCFNADQMAQILSMFEIEDRKLEILRWLYPRTYDQENFRSLRDEFLLNTSKSQFDEILEELETK